MSLFVVTYVIFGMFQYHTSTLSWNGNFRRLKVMKTFIIVLTCVLFQVFCTPKNGSIHVSCNWSTEFLCGDKCVPIQGGKCFCGNSSFDLKTVSCQLPCFGFTSCQATSRHLTCFKTDLMDNWPLLISYLMLSDLLPSLPFWPLTFWQLAFIHKWPFWQITFSQFTCLDVLPFDSLPVLSIYLFDN